MENILIFIIINLLVILVLPFLKVRWKGYLTLTAIAINVVLSSVICLSTLYGSSIEYIFPGSIITGEIPIRIDSLSAWFIVIINFTLLTGAIYGLSYMKAYKEERTNLTIHYISYVLVHASLLVICVIQNSIAFLISWEIMALASFFLIIFEHKKQQTIKAGINFLIQSHISVALLTIAFIWVSFKMNTYDFAAIATFPITSSHILLFILLFGGFGIKTGFVPFHTWLPYAHPAAPSHVSGIMSGVIIKIGIFGILRMLLLIKYNYTEIGYLILIVSVISGLYGVMLAILQHNLKKLLAYHSIENIGIIGIGIGLGCIGLGTNNVAIASLGFAGALLHTLNHSLFKSLLFYSAGNVYQAMHTMNMEKLGGLIKRMPQSALLFLVAALAICGLPPFNGFISEFLIYSGLYKGIQTASFGLLFALVFSLGGLVLIGGLAILCFTKAFGIVFLGESRNLKLFPADKEIIKEPAGKLIPMYAIVLLILSIGLLPSIFINLVNQPVSLFVNLLHVNNAQATINSQFAFTSEQLMYIGICSGGFILFICIILFIRKAVTANKTQTMDVTWGCGYATPNYKMQYTATSFVRTYRKLAEPLLLVMKKKKEVKGIFPKEGWHETHPYDKIEKWFIDKPLTNIRYFLNRFAFMQNGKLQYYILYGVLFLVLVIICPIIYNALLMMFKF